MLNFWSLFLVLVGALFLSGCSLPAEGSPNAFSHYVTEDVPVMLTAPGETEPKEAVLPKGTRVRLVEQSGPTVLVETLRGERGRIPTIDLEALDANNSDEPQAKMGKTFKW